MFSSGLYILVITVSSSVFSFFIGKSRPQIPFPALILILQITLPGYGRCVRPLMNGYPGRRCATHS